MASPRRRARDAEHDPLRDEGQAFADRLRESGVAVEATLFQGQMHGFVGLLNVLPAASDAIEVITGYLERVLSGSPATYRHLIPLTEWPADVR